MYLYMYVYIYICMYFSRIEMCLRMYVCACSAEVIMAAFMIAKFSAAVAELLFSRTVWASESSLDISTASTWMWNSNSERYKNIKH